MERPTPQDGPNSVRRALELLDAFDGETPELTIRALAARTGIPRSTAQRLTGVLIEWGALQRGPRGLRLGVKLFEVSARASAHARLAALASPIVHVLSDKTRLTANLAIRDGGSIVYLDKVMTATVPVPHSRRGGRGVIHATALGKALLAFSPAVERDEYARHPMRALTSATITSPEGLRRELQRVRREGIAYDVEESFDGLFCVAAPVLDAEGRAIAAVSVTGATALAEAQRFGPTVMAASHAIRRVVVAGRSAD